MIKSKAVSALFCSLLLGTGYIYAQSGRVATGGDATGNNGKVSYSVGQIDYQVPSGNGGTINEGLQQPFEIFVITGVEETAIKLSASVYPNPTSDFITLSCLDNDISKTSYTLFEAQGKILEHQSIKNKQTDISLSSLPGGIYYIKVLRNDKEIKTFKIVKNN